MDTFHFVVWILSFCCLVQSDIVYKSLFHRMPKLRMTVFPIKTLNNLSVEACARSCVQESSFDCQSFDMDNKIQSCRLHNNTHESNDMALIVSKSTDHYRTYFEGLFHRLPNHLLTFDHKRQISEISVEQCARMCVLEVTFRCLGFDYEVKHKNCWLTDILPSASHGLIPQVNTDYYERQSSGPLEYFLNFGYGSLQQLEGEHIYHKTVMGVSLVACAHLCLAENSFKCTSFDYVFDDKSCYLSMYIAANVYGLVTTRTDDKNVAHYEYKDNYLRRFYPTPYSAVLGHNEKTVTGVTPSACARKCLEENNFICRSFDYQVKEGTCLLSTKTGSDVGGLISQGTSQVHHFEMKPNFDCSGHLKGSSGYLASPNWPRNYGHNLNCSWTIMVPKFKIIKVSFTHLQLFKESRKSCIQNSDRLLIVDKEQVSCLENNVREFISQSNIITILFITNSKGDAPGFRLQFKTDWACGGHYTDTYGEISSPGWPSGYPPTQNCTWKIEAPPTVRIYLTFVKVDLEEHIKRSCHHSSYDVIEISEDSANSSTFLCGRYDHLTYNSTGNILYIYFTSDSRVEKSGFHAFYTFVYNKLLSNNSNSTELYDSNFTYKLELLPTDIPESGNYSINEVSEESPVHYIDLHLQPTAETPIEKSNRATSGNI
ncbi:CUB and sushi domain-containing protein 2-like isoform X2 [Saccostrea cucullata]|uniref:CUB and sushi domain-containing protein 2-like isoform X2 n=1 Tax=Saccostrea cuccullata TaxID=36930 RepID=UPI002ED5F829